MPMPSLPPTACPTCGAARAWETDGMVDTDAEPFAWCPTCHVGTFPPEEAGR